MPKPRPSLFPAPHPWPCPHINPHGPAENLSPVIEAIEGLRSELGYSRWSHLKAWCDDGQPLTTDGNGLELLYERLCIVWVNRGGGNV